LAWKIEFTEAALRQLEALDNSIAVRISKFLQQRIAPSKNPRSIGQALKGERFGEFWKYRVGDYRIIAKIQDDRLLVMILGIGIAARSTDSPAVLGILYPKVPSFPPCLRGETDCLDRRITLSSA
jgi:mRNA interferase RelE/StbE